MYFPKKGEKTKVTSIVTATLVGFTLAMYVQLRVMLTMGKKRDMPCSKKNLKHFFAQCEIKMQKNRIETRLV